MNDQLKYGLRKLEMIDDEGHSDGLVPVNNIEAIDTQNFSVDEIIAIEIAHRYKATYIYFRKFKNRASIAQAYIYDFTQYSSIENGELIDLHQKLYSSGHVPMFFVFTFKDVRIFNCYDRPAKGRKLVYKPLEVINLASDLLIELDAAENDEKFKGFSGRLFDNGTFWEDSPYSKEFQFGNSAYEKLLAELNQALKDIISQNILPASIARKVTVISILIKYLEERTDENNNSVFPKENDERICYVDGRRQKKRFNKNFFDQFSAGAVCFTDVLKKQGAALELFDYLSKHFNGGVFQFSDKERKILSKSSLTRFALFLEGELEGIQYVFWRLYSFNDLPVELISNIYEEFLEKRPGVVYTPPYLVNFLLDEAMPFTNPETEFKVLDPACGSGVFLVGAYRRLIYRWRKKNGWKKPNLKTLKTLLKDNIFGADKDPDAVNLTIFSLCLSLCDELTPLQIWEDLEFDDLNEGNLFNDDFFNLLLQQKLTSETFDLVIGNPPFESKLTTAAEFIEGDKQNQRLKYELFEGDKKNNTIKLPDNQIALLFLEQAVKLCKPKKLTCLIQPSGPLLYNNTSSQFRKYLLSNYSVPQIIDFTHISRVLFGKNGDVPTAAIFIRNDRPNDKALLHITVRRTKPHKEKIYFELDSYDFHFIPRQAALADPYIWKSNFLGGRRFNLLIQRLSSLRTLKEYLTSKIKNDGWQYGEGFIQGKLNEIQLLESLLKKSNLTKKEVASLDTLKKKYKKAPYITGKPVINSKTFYEEDLYDTTSIAKQKYFRYPSKEELFKPPHLLIKEEVKDDEIPIIFSKKYLAFKHRIVGIHAPKKDEQELIDLYEYLKSKIVLFYLAGTSAEYMVNRSSSFLKKDIDNIPYTSKKDDLRLSETERILVDDFWHYLLEFRRNGEASEIAVKDAKEKDLTSYGKVFCNILNTVYTSLTPHEPFHTHSYICYPFYFGEKPEIEFNDSAEKKLDILVKKVAGVSLRLTRVVRIYEGSAIYIIKPRKLRFWLKSTALRDADETFADLRKQGY